MQRVRRRSGVRRTFGRQRGGTVANRLFKSGIEPRHLVEIGDGAVIVALLHVGVATLVKHLEIVWLEAKALVEIQQRLTVFSGSFKRDGAIVAGIEIVRLQGDGSVEIQQGDVELAILCIGEGTK
jgi:hypothetical protein